ncbi:flagellar basal body P-ring formation chaperone FlgA [Chitinibacter sp. S2-10]|uniref:flagellar basal body P-ring formation chaperone FlgA n=1 Tax=Chitinibacter sp. S2-10 TaxID=3373597 RepID=UPI0039776499
MRKYLTALMLLLGSITSPLGYAATQDLNLVQKELERWLDQALAKSPGTPSYSINKLDSRLQLEPCRRMEVGVPQGYRLMGKTMLRVKCVDGASWSLNAPAQISMLVQYIVATRPVAANQTLSDADIMLQQGDLGALPGTVMMESHQVVGRTLNTAIAAGQPIRKEQLRAATVIQQNQRVKVIYREAGIEIRNEGIALSNATEGAIIRVRVGGNSIISGIAQDNGVVLVGQ